MSARPRGVRALWLLAAVLQLALPGAAAWADARLDAAGAHAVAHVESHTTKSCTRIHRPDCALCHLLAAPLSLRRPTAVRLDGIGDAVRPLAEPAPPLPTVARPHPQPRGPPALS